MKTNLLKTILSVVMLLAAAGAVQGRPERALAATGEFRSSPVMFVENAGQWDGRARFQLWGGATATWLTDDAIWLTVVEQEPDGEAHAANLKLSFAGASPNLRLEPFDRLDTTISYFSGSDPDQWRAAVPVWGGVRYKSLYPGIDLVASQAGGRLALRLEAQPGADLNRVQLRLEGADSVRVDAGSLYMETPAGSAALPLLSSGQPAGGAVVRPLGEGAFAIAAPFAAHNPAAAPASAGPAADNPADLLMGTFIGGGGYDEGADIQVNSAGQAYVVGTADVLGTYGFPTTPGAYDTTSNGGNYDAFVAKVAADGASLIYSTFLGGNGRDHALGLAIDAAGNAYVTGHTSSGNFPTLSAHRTAWNNTTDGFVTKLNPSGSGLVYSTYIGGPDAANQGHRIAIDASGNAYVAGTTDSSNLPVTPGAYDATYNAGTDAFVLKLSAAGSTVLYGTYLGGNGKEDGWGIAVDGGGDIFVAGHTESANFPTTPGAWDRTRGGNRDAFVARFHPAGNGGADLVYSTYLGGRNNEELYGLAVDAADNAYVAGWTQSPDFPTTPGAYDRRPFTDFDHHIFVTRLNPNGSALTYSTLMGGRYPDKAYDLALDAAGNIYIAGTTQSDDFPTTLGAFQESLKDTEPWNYDIFVARFKPAGSGVADLIYSSYMGGTNSLDEAHGIAVDGSGKVYMTGRTSANNFPTTPGAFDRTFNSGRDAFVVKLGLANSAPLTCYPLTLSHTGQGGNPTASPTRTAGCPAGRYSAGQWIVLTAAPANGWQVKDWIGTDNDGSTAITNGTTMPAGPHTVSVNYEAGPNASHSLYVPVILNGS